MTLHPAEPPIETNENAKCEAVVLRILTWRLVPFLFLLYVVAYLDRINLGFAALQMQQQLGFTDAVYGLGAGVFFAGYFFFQVPSNLVLERIGARRWLAVLMILWGIISASMCGVADARSFYALRFLLGAAEAGFFPGVIFYLRSWFPAGGRARTVARFMTAGPISGVVGGPLSGALLNLHGKSAFAGWQWMFLLEGIPAILLGAVTWFYLVDEPRQASWLSTGQKDWLRQSLQREEGDRGVAPAAPLTSASRLGAVWILAIVYMGLTSASYGVSLWLPNMIKSVSGLSNFRIGVLSAIPYIAAALIMVTAGLHSDRSGERRWHTALPAFAGALALAFATSTTSIFASIVLFSVAVVGVNAMLGPFWATSTSVLSSAAAAAGIAVINSVGNLGGFLGPYTIGAMRTSTGSFNTGLAVVAAFLALGGILALTVKSREKS